MRAHPLVISAAILSLACAAQAAADPQSSSACAGPACTVLALSADGCTWNNASQRAIRFSLISGETALMTTVLGPGEAFRETNKDHCVAENKAAIKYQAAFVTLREMADAGAAAPAAKTPMPRPKPAKALPTAVPAATTPVATAALALPRPKPAPAKLPATPRPKPESLSQASLVQPAEPPPAPPVAPVVALVPDPANPCGDACAEILFKVVGDCLWVQSQNPRSIMFQATVNGRMVVLPLEGANANKAQPEAPPKNASAYHTRQRDPFQSSSAGIPVYRAKLGGTSACIKQRSEISHFVAVYTK